MSERKLHWQFELQRAYSKRPLHYLVVKEPSARANRSAKPQASSDQSIPASPAMPFFGKLNA